MTKAWEITLLLAIPLTISGTFKVLAVLAVLARFLQYIPTCLAVLVLRRRDEPPGYWRASARFSFGG